MANALYWVFFKTNPRDRPTGSPSVSSPLSFRYVLCGFCCDGGECGTSVSLNVTGATSNPTINFWKLEIFRGASLFSIEPVMSLLLISIETPPLTYRWSRWSKNQSSSSTSCMVLPDQNTINRPHRISFQEAITERSPSEDQRPSTSSDDSL